MCEQEIRGTMHNRLNYTFIQTVLPTQEVWDDFLGHIKPMIAKDMRLVLYDMGRPVSYTPEDILTIADQYYRQGLTIQTIAAQFPQGIPAKLINITGLVADLAVLTNPKTAINMGFIPEDCSRRAKRISGLEARTELQSQYREQLGYLPELWNTGSEINNQVIEILEGLNSGFINHGDIFASSPQQMLQFTRLVCVEGYPLNLATAETLGIEPEMITEHPQLKKMLIHAMHATLNVIKTVHDETKSETSKNEIQLTAQTLGYQNLARELLAFRAEKDQILAVIDENTGRYSGREAYHPYVNPLQMLILNDLATGVSYPEMAVKYSDFGYDTPGLRAQLFSLRKLIKGEHIMNDVPFRSEFLQVLRSSIVGKATSRQLLQEMVQVCYQDTLPFEPPDGETLLKTILENTSRNGELRARLAPLLFAALEKLIQGSTVREIAKEIGCGKNFMFDYFSSLVKSISDTHFPAFHGSWTALMAHGRENTRYIVSQAKIWQQDLPNEDFTPDENTAIELLRLRAKGTSVENIIASGISETTVSGLTNLGLLLTLKLGLDCYPPRHSTKKEAEVDKTSTYPLHLSESDVFIHEEALDLSPREFSLFKLLLQSNGGKATVQDVYKLLYPDINFSHNFRQRADLHMIANNLNERLGSDLRERPLVIYNSATQTYELNGDRLRNTTKRGWLIEYSHSPVGSVQFISSGDPGVLTVKYMDGHDRQVRITGRELEVFNILSNLEHGSWISKEQMAFSIFGKSGIDQCRHIGQEVNNLRRKLCVPFPRPGYVYGDRENNFRIINYLDLFSREIAFQTSRGIFYLNMDLRSVRSQDSSQPMLRLAGPQVKSLYAAIHGLTDGATIPQHFVVKKKLVEAGILPEDLAPYTKLTNLLQPLGISEGLDQDGWQANLRSLPLADGFTIAIIHQGQLLTEVPVSGPEHDLLLVDPFSDIFSKPGALSGSIDISTIPFENATELALVEANRYPLLSAIGERVLLIRMKAGDPEARERLLRSNMRLVVGQALKLCRHSSFNNLMDLIQEGYLALENVMDKFDPGLKGTTGQMLKFSTYATWWIKQAQGRWLSNNQRIIRVPANRGTFYRKALRIFMVLSGEDIPVTPDAIALRIVAPEVATEIGQRFPQGIPEKLQIIDAKNDKTLRRFLLVRRQVEEALHHRETVSLDAPVNSDGSVNSEVIDMLEVIDRVDEYAVRESEDLKLAAVEKILQSLSARDQAIIRYRFGLEKNGDFHTQEQAGRKFKLSTTRIGQIEKEVINLALAITSTDEAELLKREI